MSIDSTTVMGRGVSPDAEGDVGVKPVGADREGGGVTPAEDFTGKGRLLEEPREAKVVQAVEELWKAQDERMKPIVAQWDANRYTLKGFAGVRVQKDVDTDTYWARPPLGSSAAIGMSKAKELGYKVTATLTVDPPRADLQPSPDDQGDVAKAELGKLILDNECSESGLNVHRLLRTGANLGPTYGSGFIIYDVDPAGGGWVPLAIDAHPAATAYDPADPEAVLRHPLGPEADEADPQEPVKKYVAKPTPAPGQTDTATAGEAPTAGPLPLTDDPREARVQWQLRLRASLVTGRQLRFLPALARGIEDANGVLIADVTEFGTLRAMFPEIDGWPKERQRKLMSWRPVPLKDVLPPGYALPGDGTATVDTDGDPRQGLPADDAHCFFFRLIYRRHHAYPDGAEIIVAGGDAVLYKGTRCIWVGPEGEPPRAECLDINVAQVRRFDDETGANPYGVGDGELLAAGDEFRAQLLADAAETMFRNNHPHLLLPLGSVIEAGRLGERDDTPISYNPGAGPPVWEDPPGMDPNTLPLYEAIGREMDSRSGLEDAQRLNQGHIKSGVQAQVIQEHALTTLSPLNDNYKAAFIRSCRIILQLYRAYATQPMLLRYTSEDGRYKVREFVNTDLGSTRDVRIAAGTSTMLSQSAKAALAAQDLEVALKAQDVEGGYRRYRQAMATNLDPQLGRDQDPHQKRVMRQLHAWRQGPPKGEEMPPQPEPQPQVDPATGAPAVDPMTGQPMLAPPPDPMTVPDPRAAALFEPLPVDAQPDVAKVRALALGDELARESTERHPRPWVLALVQAYQKAAWDAGFATREETERMQAEQAAAQAKAQADADAARQQGEGRKLELQSADKEQDRVASLERTRIQAASRAPSAEMVA